MKKVNGSVLFYIIKTINRLCICNGKHHSLVETGK